MSAKVRPDSFQLPAGVLALLVHAAFFAFLYFGINWHVEAPRGMVVDIWESLPEPVHMPEARQPEVSPPQKILPPPPPPPVEPVKPAPPPPLPPRPAQPDIVLDKAKALKAKRAEQVKQEQAKREKQALQREKLAQLEHDKQLQIEKEKQAERDRLEQLAKERLAEAEREKQAQLEREKLQTDRIKQVQAERERQTQMEQDRQTQAARERQAQEERERQAQLEREKQARAEQAAANGKLMDEYRAKIMQKIRRNIVLPPGVPLDARAVFEVTLLPNGEVLSAKLITASSSELYDTTVERAILKAHILPVPPDPGLFNQFRVLKIGFSPTDKKE